MSVLQFLIEYRENANQNHLLPVLDMMISEKVDSVHELSSYLHEIKKTRDSYTQFSVDYMNYWSIMTYLVDIIDQIKRGQHE